MNELNILEIANQVVSDERGVAYGRADIDFTRIADLLTAAGFRHETEGNTTKLSAVHIPLIMTLVKVSRILNQPDLWHKDSWVDIAGYARTAEIVKKHLPIKS